jgi:hypothetical protein
MALALGKWSDEVVQAVIQTVSNIKDYYLKRVDG